MTWRIHTNAQTIETITANSFIELMNKINQMYGDDVKIISYYQIKPT